ncbi:hypothetical protein GQ457_12G009860 [Hibiscus cannabinus]
MAQTKTNSTVPRFTTASLRPSRSMVNGDRHHLRPTQRPRLVLHPTLPSLHKTLSPTRTLHTNSTTRPRNELWNGPQCDRSELSSCPLHSVPIWTMHCNGRKNRICYEKKTKSAQPTDVKYHAIYNSGSGDDTAWLRVKN